MMYFEKTYKPRSSWVLLLNKAGNWCSNKVSCSFLWRLIKQLRSREFLRFLGTCKISIIKNQRMTQFSETISLNGAIFESLRAAEDDTWPRRWRTRPHHRAHNPDFSSLTSDIFIQIRVNFWGQDSCIRAGERLVSWINVFNGDGNCWKWRWM